MRAHGQVVLHENKTRASHISQKCIVIAKFAEKRMFTETGLHAVSQRYLHFVEQFGIEDSSNIKEVYRYTFSRRLPQGG